MDPQQTLNTAPDNRTQTEVNIDRLFTKVIGATGFDVQFANVLGDPFPNSAVTILASDGGPTNAPTASDADMDKGTDSPSVNIHTAPELQVVGTRDYSGIVVLLILALGAIAILGRM
jgi:hypothetical protein